MKWHVYLAVTGTSHMTVEADTEDAAREKADRNAYVSLCHHCSQVVEEIEVQEVIEVVREE